MKGLVVGFGLSGRSAAALLQSSLNADIAVYDENIDEAPGFLLYKKVVDVDAAAFDLIVVSPGVPLDHPLMIRAKDAGVEVVGEVELAWRYLKEGQKVLGVTGTNGKTTVTKLVAHILNEAGFCARAVGNVGTPMTQEVLSADPKTVFVVELSSYQLETQKSAVFDAGVLLNISADHLERHGTVEAYLQAKLQLGRSVRPDGSFFVEQSCFWKYRSLFENMELKTLGFQDWNDLSIGGAEIRALGKPLFELPKLPDGHHPLNLLAAYALCSCMGVAQEAFKRAVATFKLPEHRLEFVRECQGVNFFNDSKGTNVAAVIHAVSSINGNIGIIVGGRDKGGEYTPWIEKFTGKVKGIYAIGEAANKIKRELQQIFPVYLCESLEEAVEQAYAQMDIGENVLLSPGCSSFDMFDHYMHRGEEFKRIVNNLKEKRRSQS